MNKEIVLTKLTEEEYGALYAVMRPIWLDTYSFLPIEQIELLLNKYFSQEGIKLYLSKGYEYYGINGEGLLVICEREDCIYIDKLYVYPQNRGKGLASLTIKYLIAKRKKCLMLNVNRNNLVAVNCYLKNGFKVIKEEVIPLGNGLINYDYVMKKEVE